MENKYDHSKNDFLEALNVNQEKITDLVRFGVDMHFTQRKPLSECILHIAERIKTKVNDKDLSMFAAGFILAKAIEAAQFSSELINKSDFPFTAEDVMRSVREDLENEGE